MPRALITGITGQDGLYLAELLLSKGYEVFGLIRGQNNPKAELVARTVPEVTVLTGDLTDLSSLLRALRVAQPDEVYNLGAVSFVAYSWEQAALTTEVTATGVLNILEATLRLHGERGLIGTSREPQLVDILGHPAALTTTVAAFRAAQAAIDSAEATARSEAFKERFNFIRSGENPRAMAAAEKDAIQGEVMPFIVTAVGKALAAGASTISKDHVEDFVHVLTTPELHDEAA